MHENRLRRRSRMDMDDDASLIVFIILLNVSSGRWVECMDGVRLNVPNG